jgi:signal transduction histidine kinase/CheY-like chemotaxis protein
MPADPITPVEGTRGAAEPTGGARHPSDAPDDELLFAGLSISVSVLYASFAALYWWCDLRVLATIAAVASAAALGAMVVTRLARWRGVLSHAQAGIMTALFFLEAIGSSPWDASMLAFFGLTPLCMGMFVSLRGAVFWAVASSLAATAALTLGKLGITLGDASPHLDVVQTVRLAAWVPSAAAVGLLLSVLRQWALTRAQHAEASRSRFLATMSHEIRTPMNGVLGMTQLLLQSPLAPEQRDQVTLLKTSSETMISLLNDLLDFSKIDAGRMTLERIPVSPATVLREVVALFQPLALEKGITLSVTVDSSVPKGVVGDPVRLKQVFTNLVGNAVKFTLRGGVQVSARVEGAHLVVAVEDSGIGMTTEAASRLFRPFEQLESSTTRRFGGTGLGLAITHRLVSLMHGTLDVQSQPGVGSRFTLTLPCEPVELPLAEVTTESARVASSLKVLVVDDNAINLAVAEGLVRKLGFSSARAANGREAVSRCTAERFDLILMDLHMPELDGTDAAKAIRAGGPNQRTPIVALTASVLREELDGALACGMNGVLTKPLQREALAETLRAHLERPKQAA